jgi:hypothetical protein
LNTRLCARPSVERAVIARAPGSGGDCAISIATSALTLWRQAMTAAVAHRFRRLIGFELTPVLLRAGRLTSCVEVIRSPLVTQSEVKYLLPGSWKPT